MTFRGICQKTGRGILFFLLTALLAATACGTGRAEAKIGGTLMAVSEPHLIIRSVFGNTDRDADSIKAVHFLSSLSDRPPDAWDVSADRDGTVWAWFTPVDEAYADLFIASDGVILLNEDSSNLFAHFSGMTDIHWNGSIDTGNVTNMHGMFEGCGSLTELDVSGFDTENVTDMGGMFFGCGSLTELDVSGFDTGSVTDMYAMFTDCGGLAELDVSGFDTGNVTDMMIMFEGCSGLTRLDLSGFDTSSVTDMAWMFNRCGSLTELDVSGFDTSNVESMCGMFHQCGGLTRLDLSGFDTRHVSHVIRVSHMFCGCGSLTELVISPGFVLPDGADPFVDCPIQSLDQCVLVD